MKQNQDANILSIAQLARLLGQRLESEFPACWVRGELSGYRKHGSGHHYFTIKDSSAQFSAVLWRSRAQRLNFDPADGQEVEALVKLVFYGPGGRLQLDVQNMRRSGLGHLMQRFMELKNQLQAEGLFEASRKKQLPAYPTHIGILTARGGAALKDILSILERRWPGLRITVKPSAVQGESAGAELARKLVELQQVSGLDLIILGRGGGSFEDLFAFNDESLARAIVACPVPTISAVGHEVDTSISDMVADLRAPTPSAAAELAVPLQSELLQRLHSVRTSLDRRMQAGLTEARSQLRALAEHRALFVPQQRLRDARQQLDERALDLKRVLKRRLGQESGKLPHLQQNLRQQLLAKLQLSEAAVRGLSPRLSTALKREIQSSGQNFSGVQGRFRRVLELWLVQKHEGLQQLAERLERQEAGKRRELALKMGFAEVLDTEGRWLRRAKEIDQQSLLLLQFKDGSIRVQQSDSEKENPAS